MCSNLDSVLSRVELAIRAAARAPNPFGIACVPINCFLQSALPGFLRFPAEFILDQGRIDRVTAIMTRPILYEPQQRMWLTKLIENRLSNVEVSTFISRANIVSSTGSTFFHDPQDRATMVLDVNSVT